MDNRGRQSHDLLPLRNADLAGSTDLLPALYDNMLRRWQWQVLLILHNDPLVESLEIASDNISPLPLKTKAIQLLTTIAGGISLVELGMNGV